ncbi:caspase family protein [Stutzerimonas stutzeri]|uniref:caspase family protein n=1 Tax=Pseudomonadaceae TaxID=135621 RepID=UPI0016257A42|nr:MULTISPECIES: caspase family protein [Pseudomonadaceae]MDH0185808.1 caspase family protein [Stutzerimonas stutzeri]MDH1249160.1 caspase family protein [Stutzerimonas stutzeri]
MPRLNALVIGNALYDSGGNLKNPTNDAEDIAKVLTDGGFNVLKLINATFKEMKKAIKSFEKSANDGGAVSVFFFAGHGVEVDGVNYLIAKDTEAEDKTDIETGALSLDEVIKRMEPKDGATRTNIIILDACRDNPFERKWRGKPRSLAPVYAPRGTLIAFATSPGQFASDGARRNGLYTEALLKHIEEPDLPVEAMFKRVRNTLGAATKQKQISWEHTSLAGEFYFHLSAAASIENYSVAAIKDKTFVIDESKLSHRTIQALKSHNWYTQNPALDALTSEKLNGASADSLFVLGRNILQAANGSANSAIDWIQKFHKHTNGMRPEKRKAILDGILFEIFFDSKGEFRKQPKINFFNEVFELEQYPDFKDSFDFIAGALANQSNRMFAIPGKGQAVTADVQIGDNKIIEGVCISGKNYLDDEDDPFDDGDDKKVRYQTLEREQFEDELSQQMLVPKRLLKVVYNTPIKSGGKVKLPYGAEVSRPS